jgi:hypothetical protein
MTGKFPNPKVLEERDSIVIEKYLAGWPARIIAGYVGTSSEYISHRLMLLQRDGKVGKRSSNNGYRLKGY